ncbi:MAG: ABC transporter permease [Muribaculaceae bacterium]|nr:ABC transporter permease [Muribaculaceae bacterium]
MNSNKLRQLVYDLRHQPVVTWITLTGTALSVFLMMTVISMEQLYTMPFAPESNRPRLLFGQNMEVGFIGSQGSSSSALGYSPAEKLYRRLPGVEMEAMFQIESQNAEAEGSTGRPYEVKCRRVDHNFWKIYDHTLLEGRYFDSIECAAGTRMAVISQEMARNLFNNENVIGFEVLVGYVPYKVVGVVKNTSALARQASGDIFLPMSQATASSYQHGMLGNVSVVMLLEDGADKEKIRNEVKARYATLATELADQGMVPIYHEQPYDVGTVSRGGYGSNNSPDDSGYKRERMITYLILLLLPAINLSSMLHSRIRRRVSEFGIRRAFGCTRARLMGDIISENFVVTVLGALVGWLCSLVFLMSYSGLYQNGWGDIIGDTPALTMLLDWRLLLMLLGVCFILNIISASLPAWLASRVNTVEAINGRHTK